MISALLVDRCGHRRRLEVARPEAVISVAYLPRRALMFAEPAATVSFYAVQFVVCDYGRFYKERWTRPPDVPADACVFGIERALVTAEEWRDARMRAMPFELAQYLAYRKNLGAPSNGGALHISPAPEGAVWIEAWPNDERLVKPSHLLDVDPSAAVERVQAELGMRSRDEVIARVMQYVNTHVTQPDILDEHLRPPEMPDTPISLSPSDAGLTGAQPLPAEELGSLEVVDLPWHEINRKFNALLGSSADE